MRAQRLIQQIDYYLPLVRQVISQARRRALEGQKVKAPQKVVSLLESHARIVPRHKGGAAVELGRLVEAIS